MLTPFAGTVDFERWEKSFNGNPPKVGEIPLTRYWLIPQRAAAQNVHAPSHHEFRRDAPQDTGRLGSVL